MEKKQWSEKRLDMLERRSNVCFIKIFFLTR